MTDWPAMQAQMRADADRIENEEGRALLHWFADGAMTLVGFEIERPGQPSSDRLGIFRLPGEPTDEGGCEGAINYFAQGGLAPLVAIKRDELFGERVPLGVRDHLRI